MAESDSQIKPVNNKWVEKDRESGKEVPSITKNARQAVEQTARIEKQTEKIEGKSVLQKTVTVIMPIRNEAGFIKQSLTAVLNQDYPANLLDIIIVDGMSTDETRSVVGEIQSRHPNVRMLDNPARIVPTGLNLALGQIHSEVFIRVDGHCVIEPDYIRRCVDYLEQENVDGVGGPMETIGETRVSQAIALAMSSPFGVGGSAFRTIKDRRMFVDTVAFPAYKRETIRKVGLFDEELVRNQDDEYNFRLRELGGRILMAPDIHSRYYSRGSISALWRQYFQYGYWKVRVMQKHPRQMSLRQFIPPAFVTSLIVFSLSAVLLPAARLLLAGIVGVYLAANLGAALLTASRNGWRYLLYLPAAFAALHLSYGAGFLYGLAKFANCWRPEANHG